MNESSTQQRIQDGKWAYQNKTNPLDELQLARRIKDDINAILKVSLT